MATPVSPRWPARATLIAMSVVLVALLGRVAQLQLRPSERLDAQNKSRVSSVRETPLRGDMLDRRGRLIAGTRYGYRLVVDPTLLKDPNVAISWMAQTLGEDPEAIAERVHRVLAINAERLAATAKVTSASGPAAKPRAAGLLSAILAGAAGAEGEATPDDAKKPIRYLVMSDVLPGAIVERVRAQRVLGVMLEQRPVREYAAGDAAASIVGLVGFEDKGLMGAELRLDDELSGEPGKISYVRDKFGRPLWIEPGQVAHGEVGGDVRLSIDLEIQRMAHEELTRGIEEADAAGGRLVVVDPISGEVLAMVDIIRDLPGLTEFPWIPKADRTEHHKPAGVRYRTLKADDGRHTHPAMGRNRCVEDVYEPGSTFKPFVWSVITELGLARPDEVFDTEGGTWHTSYGRYIEDVTQRDEMTWCDVLVNSSNIGMIKAAERLSWGQLHEVPVRFGFGKPTNIGLPGEASGIVTPLLKWTKYSQTSYAYGHEVAVTPVQMVRAFSVFCRPGELAGTLPQIRLTASVPTAGHREIGATELQSGVVYRVLPASVARLARETMGRVVDGVEKKMKTKPLGGVAEEGWRYRMFGKSGTAEIPLGKAPEGMRAPAGTAGYFDGQYNSSFIAGGPSEQPRVVMVCVIDDPGPKRVARKEHYGSAVAGPVVRRMMDRTLTYLGIPPSPVQPEVP
ncbi:MAG: peptidoglycan D,D-transpeptidase FtsI family protein [Phycisphaerales bacterium]